MPLGPDRCNGPSGYRDSTIPPPDPQVGRGFDFLLNIVLDSYRVLEHIFKYTVFHLFYWINKVFTFTLFSFFFFLWFYHSSRWVFYFGMKCEFVLVLW
jgi:hypothetical protein